MKKTLSAVLVIMVTLFCLTPMASAASINNSSMTDSIPTQENVIEHYEYPITVNSSDWFDYSVSERVKMLTIPAELLSRMTDEALVRAIAEYPFLCDIYVYGFSVKDGIETMRHNFSALDELLNRPTCMVSLERYGRSLVEEYETQAVNVTGETYNEAEFIAAALNDIIEVVIEDATGTCSLEYPEILDDFGVYTPNGSFVAAYIPKEEHTTSYHDTRDQVWVTSQGVSLSRRGTCNYNCHSYAWHDTSASNNVVIKNPARYMSDGSYECVYSGDMFTAINASGIQYEDIIFYGTSSTSINRLHSAIYIGSSGSSASLASGMCKSKWGQAGVYIHAMANVPAEYYTGEISIWRRSD